MREKWQGKVGTRQFYTITMIFTVATFGARDAEFVYLAKNKCARNRAGSTGTACG